MDSGEARMDHINIIFTDSYPLIPATGSEQASTYFTLTETRVTCVPYLSIQTSLLQRPGTPRKDTWHSYITTTHMWGVYILGGRSQLMELTDRSSASSIRHTITQLLRRGQVLEEHSSCQLSTAFLF